MGQTDLYQQGIQKYGDIEYMRCSPENGFFPDLSSVARTDIIFFCSPNNPTGAAASRDQLTQLVKFAKDNGSIIVYDSAYAMYISDDSPKSIFEIPGAKEVGFMVQDLTPYHLLEILSIFITCLVLCSKSSQIVSIEYFKQDLCYYGLLICRLPLRQHLSLNMLDSLVFVWVGLWSPRSSFSLMDIQWLKTSTA
jgi:hypothetical protein